LKQLSKYEPALLAAVDLSENNLVELVRDLRGSGGVDIGDALQTYVVDFGSAVGESFIEQVGPFDLVLHFAAMKHVRGERDNFSLSSLIQTNVLKVDRFLTALKKHSPCEVFAISTDKACAPANLMGASKRLMEQVLLWHSRNPGSLISTGNADTAPLRRVACTRFANVAFSDGSLLAGFLLRVRKKQPLAGPSDIRRYFITEEEAGQICLLTLALAKSGQIFVPRLNPSADCKTFDQIAEIVLADYGFRPAWYKSDEEAKSNVEKDLLSGRYPCCFTPTDTSGEKELEEFVGPGEILSSSQFSAVDIIGHTPLVDEPTLTDVMQKLTSVTDSPDILHSKSKIVELVSRAVPALRHLETGRNLDQKM
jgi:nucleoside-diphosphate-sugar epimerase